MIDHQTIEDMDYLVKTIASKPLSQQTEDEQLMLLCLVQWSNYIRFPPERSSGNTVEPAQIHRFMEGMRSRGMIH